MKITKLFKEFFNSEKTGGLLLIICTAISLIISNSPAALSYIGFWEMNLGSHTLVHWINDGLMAIFFLLIGLELERELYVGELSNPRDAAFPIFAAIGGVVVPAGIFIFINFGKPEQAGFGIPMATDIAFAIGMLAMLGNRVPLSLKIFLTALAVIDDLCAILIIAIFYSSGISWLYLFLALGIWGVLFVFNRLKKHNLFIYLAGGVLMWYCMLQSGIHATLAGVMLAFVIPFGDGGEDTVSYKLQHLLHKPVAFIIIPLFALANTCIIFQPSWADGLLSGLSIAIIAGLFIGKPLGILLFAWLGTKLSICSLPEGLNWKQILGAGLLAGIGFTMSIFITILAFADAETVAVAKIAILIASLLSAIAGLIWLYIELKNKPVETDF